MRLLGAVSPYSGTDALEAARCGMKGLLCWASARELGNERIVFPSWGDARSAADGSAVTAAG